METDTDQTFSLIGEFTVWMAGADSSSEEALFFAVETYGSAVRQVNLPETGKPLTDHPSKLLDRFCMTEALVNHLCSRPPKWRKISPLSESLREETLKISTLRNALFHGQLQGVLGESPTNSRRFKSAGKRLYKPINEGVTPTRLETAIRLLTDICVYFELAIQAMGWDFEGWPNFRCPFSMLSELNLSKMQQCNAAGEFA